MTTPEQTIRQEFDNIESVIIGNWYPLVITINGRTQKFLANMKKIVKNGKNHSSIHLLQIRLGRPIAGMDARVFVSYYKLDGKNNLKEEGVNFSIPTDGQLSKWKSSGFEII